MPRRPMRAEHRRSELSSGVPLPVVFPLLSAHRLLLVLHHWVLHHCVLLIGPIFVGLITPVLISPVYATEPPQTESEQIALWPIEQLYDYASLVCKNDSLTPLEHTQLIRVDQNSLFTRGNTRGERYQMAIRDAANSTRSNEATGTKDSTGTHLVELDIITSDGNLRQLLAKTLLPDGRGVSLINLTPDCRVRVARQIVYNKANQPVELRHLTLGVDSQFVQSQPAEPLNPPVPDLQPGPNDSGASNVPAPTRVGMIDSGVDYRLDAINRRLARDAEGNLIGYDFWDMDARPFDAHPINSGFVVQRHGTATAMLLLEEAPAIELVSYRYPRPDMQRMAALVSHADRNDVHILGMPLGSNKAEDWQTFDAVARKYPHILFVVSAGNNGRNIDDSPVYPAVLEHPNLLVVTSSDDYVRPAERTNWGAKSVDILLPAENLQVTSFGDRLRAVSGSSYAVSRLTALAANLKALNPALQAPELIARIKRDFVISTQRTGGSRSVALGYIPDPLVVHAVAIHRETLELSKPTKLAEEVAPENTAEVVFDPEILILDRSWSVARVEEAMTIAASILRQCDIIWIPKLIHLVSGPDYLKDLSIGTAHTLLQSVRQRPATIVLARDTRMAEAFSGEAFGKGNTQYRPWLRNTVWLMPELEEPGVAMAHELFHILANNGRHSDAPKNLMQSTTKPGNLNLSRAQCQQAIEKGVVSGLLKSR